MSRRLARALGVRLVAIALGLIAGLVVLEIALQLAAVVTRSTARDADVVSGAGVRHVLAVGDSNTYGLYLDREQAYPIVFAQRENAIARERVSVVNAAFPGVNSSQLRNLLPELLRSVRPTDVFVMVGANDWWTLPEPIRVGGTEPSRPLWLRSRVLRLFVILERWFEAPAVLEKDAAGMPVKGSGTIPVGDERWRLSWTRLPAGNPQWEADLESNLRAIVTDTAAAGATPWLLTYPAEDPIYGRVNQVLRRVAAETATNLVDAGAEFRARCPSSDCRDLFFPDHHPTAEGHVLVADLLIRAWASR